jgi:TonB family protein
MNSGFRGGPLLIFLALLPQAGSAQDPCDARSTRHFPCYTPFDVKPVIVSKLDARRSMARHYPKSLKIFGLGATVHLDALLDDQGKVRNAVVTGSSGFASLDTAAIHAASEMTFTPAKSHGSAIWAWIQLPLTFCVSCPETTYQLRR